MKKKANILLISSEFPPGPGGIGNHAYNLYINLEKLNYNIVLFVKQSYESQDIIAQYNSKLKSRIYLFSPNNSIINIFKNIFLLKKIIKLNDIDLTLASGKSSVFLIGLYDFIFKKVPFVSVLHGGEYLSSKLPIRYLSKVLLNKSDSIIAVSSFTAKKNIELGLHKHLIKVINNGANFFKKQLHLINREKFSFVNGTNKILFTIGSVTPRKGQVLIINAMKHIIEKYSNCHYVMAGLPIYKKKYYQLAKSLGVEKNVHFLGRIMQYEIDYILSNSDIYLLTSQFTKKSEFEGFGISVIESAFYGIPAIVTNSSGVAETVINHKTGYVCKESMKDIADKVIELLEDDDKRNSMGENAKLRALQQFTWNKVVNKYSLIIKDLIK